jgi:hypothetical protein
MKITIIVLALLFVFYYAEDWWTGYKNKMEAEADQRGTLVLKPKVEDLCQHAFNGEMELQGGQTAGPALYYQIELNASTAIKTEPLNGGTEFGLLDISNRKNKLADARSLVCARLVNSPPLLSCGYMVMGCTSGNCSEQVTYYQTDAHFYLIDLESGRLVAFKEQSSQIVPPKERPEPQSGQTLT